MKLLLFETFQSSPSPSFCRSAIAGDPSLQIGYPSLVRTRRPFSLELCKFQRNDDRAGVLSFSSCPARLPTSPETGSPHVPTRCITAVTFPPVLTSSPWVGSLDMATLHLSLCVNFPRKGPLTLLATLTYPSCSPPSSVCFPFWS